MAFVRADATRLPLPSGAADLLLDRGRFHHLPSPARACYAQEAAHVPQVGSRLLLRPCLNSAGISNGLNETIIRVGGVRL